MPHPPLPHRENPAMPLEHPACAPLDESCVLLVAAAGDARSRWQHALAASGLAVRSADGEVEAVAVVRAEDVAAVVIDAGAGDPAASAKLVRAVCAVRGAGGGASPPVLLTGADAGRHDALLQALGDDARAVVDLLPADIDARLLARKVAGVALLHAEARRLRRQLRDERDERQRESRLGALMIAVLTHDLRTPLTAVTLSAEIAEKRSTNDSVRAAAGRIKASVARMSATLGHLLNVVGGHGRPPAVELAPGDLADAARNAVANFAAGRAQPTVTLRVDGETQAVLDASRLAQAFARLVALVVEHGGTAAPVTVDVDGTHRAYLRVRISTPATFSEAAHAQLFSEAPAPGAPPPGVGPALAEVEGVIRAHGGTIVGHSDPATGTAFDMMLPRADVAPFGSPGASAVAPDSRG